MQYIENKTFDEIKVGDTAELTRTLRKEDLELFAVMSGDINPEHVDELFARTSEFHKVIAHGMWGGSLISALLGTELPGPGATYVSQSLQFRRPVGLGDTVTVRVRVREKREEDRRIVLDCTCVNQGGEAVIEGEVEVIAPTEKVRRPRALLPEAHLHERGRHFAQLVDLARKYPAIRTAVVHPCDGVSLLGALEAAKLGLITPVLVGPSEKIKRAAQAAGAGIDRLELVDAPHSHAAAARAVAMARAGEVEALMKGALHTDEIMGAVVDPALGLRTERRISHIFVIDTPNYPKLLLVTDAAINIEPGLEEKKDIVQNAIDLALTIGVQQPKVAVLSAVETVYPRVKSTVEAAALCKMADRGQITGGVLDGPLAFDNAISKSAAEAKHITSPVAGDADVLVTPDLVSGNILAKQLIYLAGADAAGIVLGARVPIMLTSRADGTLARTVSCALAQLYVHRRSRLAS
jgi:phosphotransacetylase/acyl dehydratase